jgi:hypothetical protein
VTGDFGQRVTGDLQRRSRVKSSSVRHLSSRRADDELAVPGSCVDIVEISYRPIELAQADFGNLHILFRIDTDFLSTKYVIFVCANGFIRFFADILTESKKVEFHPSKGEPLHVTI